MSAHPYTPGGDTAPPGLHNSGFGPRPVFHTVAAGKTYRVDLRGLTHPSLRSAVLRSLTFNQYENIASSAATQLVAPGDVYAIADALRITLGGADDGAPRSSWLRPAPRSAEEACAAIARLASRVAALGWLVPFHGLVTANSAIAAPDANTTVAESHYPWLPTGGDNAALRLAWCICAISYLSPPLILWTREPSLAWWRSDRVIQLRWLGQGVASEPAATATPARRQREWATWKR